MSYGGNSTLQPVDRYDVPGGGRLYIPTNAADDERARRLAAHPGAVLVPWDGVITALAST